VSHIGQRNSKVQTQCEIAYLLSYYNDGGSSGSACSYYSDWEWFTSYFTDKKDYCQGHFGDSEFITVDVTYDPATQHWEFIRAFLSAHWGTDGDESQWWTKNSTITGGSEPALQFPAKTGWYIRSWVAYNKHANYPSFAACEAGVHGNDECLNGPDVRLEHFYTRNIGSQDHPTVFMQGNTQGCAPSADRFIGNGRVECYWKPGDIFEGWQLAQNGYFASAYYDVLAAMGFTLL
jgi:hypothetical protein